MVSYRRLVREASRVLSVLGDTGLDMLMSMASFVQIGRRDLSCALYRCKCGVCFESMFSIARAMGIQFMPG